MSVEDIQEVNRLAQELLDHGLEASREDAVAKAESMLNKKLAEAKPEASQEEDGITKIKNIAERTKEHMDRQIESFKQDITSICNEINNIKKEIQKLRSPTGEFKASQESGLTDQKVEEASEPQQNEEVQEEPKSEEAQPEAKEEKKESHPKRGNYNSDDVSVEKIFYCGTK